MVNTKKHLRNCNLCGKEYRYCGNCSEFKHLPSYMVAWCGENCKDIDSILSNWGAKIIDSKTAAELLKTKDLSRMEYWNDSYKAAYAKILEDVGEAKKDEPIETKEEVQKESPKQEEPKLTISEEVKKASKEAKPRMQTRTRIAKEK